MVENDEYDSVDDAVKDTWISSYVNTYEYRRIEDAYKAVADTVLQYNTKDRDIVWEIINGSGANDSNEAWSAFYSDILTPTIGIDGFWTTWSAKDGKRANVIIAFDSSQVKSADPVTFDDDGKVIPLSERFNPEQQDIRCDSRNMQELLDEELLNAENMTPQEILALYVEAHKKAITEIQQHHRLAFERRTGALRRLCS